MKWTANSLLGGSVVCVGVPVMVMDSVAGGAVVVVDGVVVEGVDVRVVCGAVVVVVVTVFCVALGSHAGSISDAINRPIVIRQRRLLPLISFKPQF